MFVVPLYGAKTSQEQGLLPAGHTNYVQFRGSLSDDRSRSLDLTKFILGGQSMSQLCIIAAMSMGCSRIHVLGLDNDRLSHDGMDRPCYECKTIKDHPQAHGGASLYIFEVTARAIVSLWSGYEGLLTLSRQESIDILNAKHGGFLDVFERADYESIIESR